MGGLMGQTPTKPRLSERLNQVIETSAPDAYIPVGIFLQDRVDAEALDKQLYAEDASLKERSLRVMTALKKKAADTQGPLLDLFAGHASVEPGSVQPLWVTNIIFLHARADLLDEIADHPAIAFIDLDAELDFDKPTLSNESAEKSSAIQGGHEPGHDAIGATDYWRRGYYGYGVIVAGFDTGVNSNHPAMRDQWRGNVAPVNESWFVLGFPGAMPSDCYFTNHGTHTMGVMCGLDRTVQDTIGVAFNAQWIGSPTLCGGGPSMSRHIAAFQWAMDPDSNITTQSDMPAVICNSWFDAGATNECNGIYKNTFDAVEAVGIAIVFSAGNNGDGQFTISPPKNINTSLTNVFCVGSVDGIFPGFPISAFSSRGPSACGGTGSLSIKPEVVAPGISVRSAVFGSHYERYNGTSMSAPHVAGAIALLKEAFPSLTGTELKEALYFSALDLGTAGEDNAYGRGLINVGDAHDTLVAWGHIPVIYQNDVMAHSTVNLPRITCTPTPTPGIVIKNLGQANLGSATVIYQYGGSSADTLNWTGNLIFNQTDTLYLPTANFSFGDHSIDVWVSNPNGQVDDRPLNDHFTHRFVVDEVVQATGDTIFCAGTSVLSAAPVQSGTLAWFDAFSLGNEFGTGPVVTAPYVSQTTTWFVDILKQGDAGPVDNQFGTGGIVSFSDAYLTFDAMIPFILKQVTVYSDRDTTVNIHLSDGINLLAQRNVTLVPGSNRITLDFEVDDGRDLQLGTGSGAYMYRNLTGATYPYVLPNVLAITGSGNPDPERYYFFYDWLVEYGSFCGRTAVRTEVENSISPTYSANPANPNPGVSVQFYPSPSSGISWFWDFGDGTTTTMEEPMHTYTASGIYDITLIMCNAQGCCDTLVKPIVVGTVGLEEERDESVLMQVFPNPNMGQFQVRIEQAEARALEFEVVNVLGQVFHQHQSAPTRKAELELSLGQIPRGIYFVKVRMGNQVAVRKVMIE